MVKKFLKLPITVLGARSQFTITRLILPIGRPNIFARQQLEPLPKQAHNFSFFLAELLKQANLFP